MISDNVIIRTVLPSRQNNFRSSFRVEEDH